MAAATPNYGDIARLRALADAAQSAAATAQAAADAAQAAANAAQATANAAVPQTRLINTTAPIEGGGELNADLTISHAASGVTAGTYGDSSHVPRLTVDGDGHITGVSAAAISSGAGWTPTKPTAAAFTTLRNGTGMTPATIADNSVGSGVNMTFKRNSTTSNWMQSYILQSVAGGVPFRAEALISFPFAANNNWFMLGLAISSDNAADVGRHVSVHAGMNDSATYTFFPECAKNTGLNAQEVAVTSTLISAIACTGNTYWMAIEYDGTNINLYASFDGRTWDKYGSEPKTFFTGVPNLVGFGWEAVASDGGTALAWCSHFKVTTNLSDKFGLNA